MLKRGRFIAYAIATIMALAGLTCGGGGGDGTNDPTSSPTAEATGVETITPPREVGTPSDETIRDIRAVESLVQAVIEALVQQSSDGLRAALSEDARATVAEEELGQLASCVPEGATLEIGGVFVQGEETEITLMAGRPGGEPERVAQLWHLKRQPEGSWALGELPPCPFE